MSGDPVARVSEGAESGSSSGGSGGSGSSGGSGQDLSLDSSGGKENPLVMWPAGRFRSP